MSDHAVETIVDGVLVAIIIIGFIIVLTRLLKD